MNIRLREHFVRFVQFHNLGDDVLLWFAIGSLKQQNMWFCRIDGLEKQLLGCQLSGIRSNCPREFTGVDFFAPFDISHPGLEYGNGIYVIQFWVSQEKFIAFLFAIEGAEVELKAHVVLKPKNTTLDLLASCWSVYFWSYIEAYHARPVRPTGHRAIGRYMLSKEDEPVSYKPIAKHELSSESLEKITQFPSRYSRCLLRVFNILLQSGIDLDNPNSPVLFFYLAVGKLRSLIALAETIKQHPSPAILLFTNDSDIAAMMRTGHTYARFHEIQAYPHSYLYVYEVRKR